MVLGKLLKPLLWALHPGPAHLSSPFSSLFNLFVFSLQQAISSLYSTFPPGSFLSFTKSNEYFNCYDNFPFLVILSHLAYLIVWHWFKNCFPFYVYCVYVFHNIWKIFIKNFSCTYNLHESSEAYENLPPTRKATLTPRQWHLLRWFFPFPIFVFSIHILVHILVLSIYLLLRNMLLNMLAL